ncbi:hypothetical protein BAE44_0004255 [Dichanthelium oligosanthes]|uniref:DUF1618 domain-containing protein n=1 Tax=Dichanthelium oligosanthes TaxID=888268 RepID=A0A1E5WBC5_9POAL|nr:hypothetical protein BAE44_0004255 [Dichanthelium oligosanthes]
MNTTACARTTTGLPISVSLRLAAPPEGSRVCVQLPAGVKVRYIPIVVAVHGDSVLVQVAGIEVERCMSRSTTDHFIYNGGDAAADPPRPPSLCLLPPRSLTGGEESAGRRYLYSDATGLLRRGEGEFVVAELNMKDLSDGAELVLLRLHSAGRGEWSVKRPPISRYDYGKGGKLPSSWRNDTVIPFGDRLCWVDLSRGLLFSDVIHDSPGLRYVPLPVDPCFGRCRSLYRNVCATAAASGAIKFVNVFPHRCCGRGSALTMPTPSTPGR